MSRGLTYWDDATIKLIREKFVAVSVPTWVCRDAGAEGEFLRRAGIDKHWVTSSGYMNCISAGGTFLGRRPSQQILDDFVALPEIERKPLSVDKLTPGRSATPSPPDGGLVLRVHARFLTRDRGGVLRHARASDFPLMVIDPRIAQRWQLFLEPNTEYMWITREEERTLLPANPAAGQRVEIDAAIPMRMARFHLNPKRATTSEGGIVSTRAVKLAQLAAEIGAVTEKTITARLVGRVHWGSGYDEEKATTPNGPLGFGYEAGLSGRIEFDRERGEFSRFDLVANGDVWGRWGDANRNSLPVERPGRQAFGFVFELATGDSPTDRIPPGGNGRTVAAKNGYFSTKNE